MRRVVHTVLIFFVSVSLPFALKGQSNINISNLLGFDGEPSLAINPSDPNNLIAGWMRLRQDGKIWIATRASFDGGETWSAINFLPHDTVLNGSADISIDFHRTGAAYASYINFRTSPDTAGAVFLVKSTNGGLSWSIPRKVIDMADTPDLPIDRPWIAVDNSSGLLDGTVYVTTMSAYWVPAGLHHVYLRSTRDDGLTWSPIRQVDTVGWSPAILTRSYGALSVGAGGRVYVVYLSYDTSVSPFLRHYIASSNDAGATFQRYVVGNVILSTMSAGFTNGWSLAADPHNNGVVVLAWIDSRNGDNDVLMKRSADGGQTWSVPVRVNDDSIGNGAVQDEVWTSFSTTGTLGVVWRDRRLYGSGTVPFDVYGAVSTNGGVSFGSNVRLSTASSPHSPLACCNSFLGVAINDTTLYANWGDFRQGEWEIYLGRNANIATGVKHRPNDATIPREALLYQNFPNPFNPTTEIRFQIPEVSRRPDPSGGQSRDAECV